MGGDNATSLVRHMHQTDGGERGDLHWGRAGRDEAPFRGHRPPVLREEEYNDQVVRTGDPHIRVFDMSVPEDQEAYLDVLTKIINGNWGQAVHVDRQFVPEKNNWVVYFEWVQWYMEMGTQQSLLEAPKNGQARQ
jgi:hypothetical protein